jgi:hypothetical protein
MSQANGPGNLSPEELQARLAERERQELAAVHRRLSTDTKPCRCGNCAEADAQARDEWERRFDPWYPY